LNRDARGHLDVLFHVGALGGLSDARLLELFLRREEAAEAAFTALVERHGPMVLRACRSVLLDPNDAHDAFQATFLVLVRKADRVRKRESVRSWLVGVALRVARRTRVDATKRRAREFQRAVRADRWGEAVRPEGCPELLEEIGRLPERFRRPVVLCYLEGLSVEEAAQSLGCPRGTVLSRLARARERLRDQLARRGVSPAVLPMADLVRPAALSRSLIHTTVQAALWLRRGGGIAAGAASWLAARGAGWTAAAFVGVAMVWYCGALAGPLQLFGPRTGSQPPPRAGRVDVSFGEGGTVPIQVVGTPTKLPPAVALQADGKVVVLTATGEIGDDPRRHVLARYQADGRLDAGFGQGGFATVGFAPIGVVTNPSSRPRVVVQPDGKILVGVDRGGTGRPWTHTDLGLQRFLPDGTPDPGFGESGTVGVNVGLPSPEGGRLDLSDIFTGLALQEDGKILVSGVTFGPPGAEGVFALARLLPSGALDASFGDDGRVTTDFPVCFDGIPRSMATAYDLAVGPGGRIALVGSCRTCEGPGSRSSVDLALAVYDASGLLDLTFGDGGRLVLDLGGQGQVERLSHDEAHAVAFAPDGSLLVAGSASDRLMLARLDASGRLDRDFGDGGIVLGGTGRGGRGRVIALQGDGKILVGGVEGRFGPDRNPYVLDPNVRDFGLARIWPDGTLDRGFGVEGIIQSDLGEEDSVEGLAVAPDGTIYVLGSAVWGTTGLRVKHVLTKHHGT
jgi:RNA polymerase sigma factor (sigma-70 family)